MDLVRSYEFFKPEECPDRINIIGCGAVGSAIAENVARLGLTNVALYDFDKVESHNIANQMYYHDDIGKYKIDAIAEQLCKINPDMNGKLKLFYEGYVDQPLSGYVFLCVDDIELRKAICEKHSSNPRIKGVFDVRVGLEDAQFFAADWSSADDIERMLDSMQFTREEAEKSQPVSACNQPLSVAPTIRAIVSICIANFMQFAKGQEWRHIALVNPFRNTIVAY